MSNGMTIVPSSQQSLTAGCRSLKRELVRAQEEIKRIQSVPLVIGQFMEAIDQKYAEDYTSLPVANTLLQHRYCTVLNWLKLCCPHIVDARPREAQTLLLRRSAPPLKLASGHTPT